MHLDGRFTRTELVLRALVRPRRRADALGRTDFDFFAAAHSRTPAPAAELEAMRSGERLVALEEREVSPGAG